MIKTFRVLDAANLCVSQSLDSADSHLSTVLEPNPQREGGMTLNHYMSYLELHKDELKQNLTESFLRPSVPEVREHMFSFYADPNPLLTNADTELSQIVFDTVYNIDIGPIPGFSLYLVRTIFCTDKEFLLNMIKTCDIPETFQVPSFLSDILASLDLKYVLWHYSPDQFKRIVRYLIYMLYQYV